VTVSGAAHEQARAVAVPPLPSVAMGLPERQVAVVPTAPASPTFAPHGQGMIAVALAVDSAVQVATHLARPGLVILVPRQCRSRGLAAHDRTETSRRVRAAMATPPRTAAQQMAAQQMVDQQMAAQQVVARLAADAAMTGREARESGRAVRPRELVVARFVREQRPAVRSAQVATGRRTASPRDPSAVTAPEPREVDAERVRPRDQRLGRRMCQTVRGEMSRGMVLSSLVRSERNCPRTEGEHHLVPLIAAAPSAQHDRTLASRRVAKAQQHRMRQQLATRSSVPAVPIHAQLSFRARSRAARSRAQLRQLGLQGRVVPAARRCQRLFRPNSAT
jgi:hypothetical protein